MKNNIKQTFDASLKFCANNISHHKFSHHKVVKCAKSWPIPWWFGQFLAIPPSFRPKTLVSTHPYHGATMPPAPKLEKPWQPRCHNTRWSSVPNPGPFHCGFVNFLPFPPLFLRKPLFRHTPTMLPTTKSQTPWHVMLSFITNNYINYCVFNNYEKNIIQKLITINLQGFVSTAPFWPTQEHAI
jgi:hypothetical protein